MQELTRRRARSDEQCAAFQRELQGATKVAENGEAAVCATGSLGRGEVGRYSDFDLLLITRSDPRERQAEVDRSTLSRLDEIVLQAHVIQAVKKLTARPLDGDGKFFKQFTIRRLVRAIGAADDDATNAFTSRLLLLLESRPIIGAEVHNDAISEIVAAYWTDFKAHPNNFIPAFFANDILRLWRTFCVNYEARTRDLPEERRIERKVKNLKLKYSRMLTCYSAIAFLLHQFEARGTVDTDAALLMAFMTPIERVEHIATERGGEISSEISALLKSYDAFLEMTDQPEPELLAHIGDPETFEKYRAAAHEFGDRFHSILTGIGSNTRLHRMIMV